MSFSLLGKKQIVANLEATQSEYQSLCSSLSIIKSTKGYSPSDLAKEFIRSLKILNKNIDISLDSNQNMMLAVEEFFEQHVFTPPPAPSDYTHAERVRIRQAILDKAFLINHWQKAFPGIAVSLASAVNEKFLAFIPQTSSSDLKAKLFISLESCIPDINAQIEEFHGHFVKLQSDKKLGNLFVRRPQDIGTDAYAEELEKLSPYKATSKYFNLSPKFFSFLETKGVLDITDVQRNGHFWISAGSGHGKTQLLQNLIYHDLKRADAEGTGLCVIDGQGELIPKLLRSSALEPIKDRVVYIDANDVDYPIALNPLALLRDNASVSRKNRLKDLTFTKELFHYIFSAIVKRELTGKQKTVFDNAISLMQVVPGATLKTLLELFREPKSFTHFFNQVDALTKDFFTLDFHTGEYRQTRGELISRLNSICTESVLSQMLLSTENKIDFVQGIREGKIFLINSASNILGKDHGFFGRIFIALILMASRQVSDTANWKKKLFFTYMDEAQDYVDEDESVEELLDKTRKFGICLTFSHQRLDQLSKGVISALRANTNIKAFAKLGITDEAEAARTLRVEPDFVFNMKSEDRKGAEYAFITSSFKTGIKVFVPFGILESSASSSTATKNYIIKQSRSKYAYDPSRSAKAVPSPSSVRSYSGKSKNSSSGFAVGKAVKP